MKPFSQPEQEGRRLVEEARRSGILLRLLGGLAVGLRCPSAQLPEFKRVYGDLDMVTDKEGGIHLEAFFPRMGYVADQELNTLNGDRRQLYYHAEEGARVDIFVGEFEMCHRLPITERLALDTLTVPLAELFLTKAQIVALNRKDLLDLLVLFADHSVGEHDSEMINGVYISHLCARDWGLFTTTRLTMEKMEAALEQGEVAVSARQVVKIRDGLKRLREQMNAAPKSLAWKARAVIGTRQRWYEEVEEVER